MENITNLDYRHAKSVWVDIGIQNLRNYFDLYVNSDTLLLPDVFQNFRSKYIEIYELDPANFLSVSRLAWLVRLERKRRSKIGIADRS